MGAPPAPSLPAWLSAALPEHLRAQLGDEPRRPGRLTLRFELPGAPPRRIDVYLLDANTRAFVRVGPIGFGYRVDAGAGDQAEAAQLCRTVAEALAAHGERLAAHLREPVPESPPEPRTEPPAEGVTLKLEERTLARAGVHAALAKLRAIRGPVREVELFLLAPCVQSCSFCVFPQVRGTRHQLRPSHDAVAWLAAILADLRGRPGPRDVVLSGPDCLRHPQLDALLELFADEREIGLELLGPLTRLSEPALVERIAALPQLRGVRLSLYGARPDTHDRIVGCPGAHAQVLAAIRNCTRLGVAVGLATVITPENVDELPELLALVRELGLQTQLNLYHPESWSGTPVSWREVALARVIVAPEQLLAACERIADADLDVARARQIPHCWLPPRLRARILDAPLGERRDFAFAPACRDCAARARCPGISRPALEQLGPDCARPIRA